MIADVRIKPSTIFEPKDNFKNVHLRRLVVSILENVEPEWRMPEKAINNFVNNTPLCLNAVDFVSINQVNFATILLII
ncbi:hypothetical protein D3C80_1776290 [compost metagenome]